MTEPCVAQAGLTLTTQPRMALNQWESDSGPVHARQVLATMQLTQGSWVLTVLQSELD